MTSRVFIQAVALASPAKKADKPAAKAKKGALTVGNQLPDFSVETDTSSDDKKVMQASKVRALVHESLHGLAISSSGSNVSHKRGMSSKCAASAGYHKGLRRSHLLLPKGKHRRLHQARC